MIQYIFFIEFKTYYQNTSMKYINHEIMKNVV